MDNSDPSNYKPCVLKFLDGNEVQRAATIHDIETNKIQETFNWKIKGISGLEILNQADNKVVYKCDKGSFGHSYYTITDKQSKKEQ